MRSFIALILFFSTAVTFGQTDAKALFDKASQSYADGDYQSAIQDYKNILNQGKISAEVYYNLGNAFYKLDSLAPSIYYYNKALQLAPNDLDIQNNLQFANDQTVDLIEVDPKTGWSRFTDQISKTFTYNGWAVFAVICSFLMLIFGVWYYFARSPLKKRLFFTLGVLSILLAVGSVLLAYNQYNAQQDKTLAIVFAKAIDVHAEPNHNSDTIFELHEGTRLRVIDQFNGYYRIKLDNNKRGWLKEEAIKVL